MPAAITVLITTRDRPALLADALASVAWQSYPPAEIFVADTGTEPARLAARIDAIPITHLTLPSASAARARNRIAEQARGDLLALLDDDDRWLPGHLAGLAEAFAAPGTRLAFRDCVVIRERIAPDGARHDVERREIARDWDDALMRSDDFVPPSTWGLAASLWREVGRFDPAFRFSDDWDFLLRVRRVTKPVRVPGVTAEIRMRPGDNASANFGPERLADLRLLESRHGLPPLVPKTFWEVAETVAQSR